MKNEKYSARPSMRRLCLPLLLALMMQSVLAADNGMLLNFVNLDLDSAAKVVAELTGRNVLIDPKAKGTLNVISSKPVDKKEAYQLFLAALRSQGLTALDDGTVLRIVAEADARQMALPVLNGKGKARGSQMVTQVVRLNNGSASRLAELLRPLVSNSGNVTANPADNSLVLTDYADNLHRLMAVVDAAEAPQASETFTLSLQYAPAVEVANTLAKLMPEVAVQGTSSAVPTPEGQRRSVIVADANSNALIVRAATLEQAKEIRNAVAALDKPAARANFRVVYLKNAEASRLVETLRGVLVSKSGALATQQSAQTTAASSGNKEGTVSSQPQGSSISGQVDGIPVAIQADTNNNALLISAPDPLFNSLKAAIEQLDVRRAQVYVEAMIAEINTNKAGQLGVQWLLGGLGNVSLVGATAFGSGASNLGNIINSIMTKNPTGIPTGATVGIMNGNPNDPNNLPTLGVIASALESDGLGNVLSAPTLLTLDNEEASILVGQNIPLITGSQPSTGSNPNPFTTVERKDIGVSLKIRPQVSEGGAITLNIAQEVSAVDPTVNTGNAGIATTKREIKTRVLVENGQLIALGGLIADNVSQNYEKVPGLGSLPLIGPLFRNESRNYSKTNLVIFIRPTIVKDRLTADAIANQRYQELRTQQGDFSEIIKKQSLLPDLPKVQLPVKTQDGQPAVPPAPAKADAAGAAKP